MIFITTGTQEPFDRLIKAMDALAPSLYVNQIIAQTNCSRYNAKYITTYNFININTYNSLINEAELIISHAGIGTIISALVCNKPILIFPRLASLKEHRNNHQIDTALAFEKINYVHVAYNIEELKTKTEKLLSGELKQLKHLGSQASEELINSISEFIFLNK